VERIGVIGTGAMGVALLERLKLAGVAAVCYDSYPPSLEQARALGMGVVGSSAEVAKESTLIDIVVRTDQDMLDGPWAQRNLGNREAGNLVAAS